MRIRLWLCVGMIGLLIGGCAGMQGAASPEAKAVLAPTGKLRVAFLLAPLYATKDPATGELKGVAVDLGKELARQVGVPFDPVVYAGVPALIGGAKSGEWDVVLIAMSAERAATIHFSAPFMELEQGYLVRAGAPIGTATDVDQAGVRIGVLESAVTEALLSRTLKHATLVRTKSVAELFALLGSGKADVIATGKPGLFAVAATQPGSRVLDGRILVEPIGVGVPKDRNAAAAVYVAEFVEQAKLSGFVKTAIERAGLRGVVVAPLR